MIVAEKPHWGRGRDRGGPVFALQNGDFSEETLGSLFAQQRFPARDPDLPFHDQVETVSGITLLKDERSRGVLLFANLVREIHELTGRQPLEQRQALQVECNFNRVQHVPMILYILRAGQTIL